MTGLGILITSGRTGELRQPGHQITVDKRRAYRLLGESLRDIGILVVVFGPLDAFFQREPPAAPVLAVTVAGALLLIAVGIII